MPQLIYSIAAIFVLGIAFLNVNQKVHGTDERLMFSELTVEMTSVGAEVLDEIGKQLYDPITASGLMVPVAALSPNPYPAASACDPDDPNYSGCSTIGDFHGKTATRDRQRIHLGKTYTVPYNVTNISVQYVTETPPHGPSATATFAKEVTLTVQTPVLVDANDDPFEFEMSRVYMFPDL